jgi:hypothetical protein
MTSIDASFRVLSPRSARFPLAGVIEDGELLKSPSFHPPGAEESAPLVQKARMPLCAMVICLGIFLACPLCVIAQQPARKAKFDVETIWPGIHFKLVRIERILDERLLIVVRIVATPRAPVAGTLIAGKPTLPLGATVEDLRSERNEPRPFSLASSVLIDDLTLQRFPALAPVFPIDKEYAPGEMLGYLSPGRAEVLTLQFKVPPSALIADGGTPEKQTVSLLLTNAKAPMTGIPIPSVETKDFTVQRQ